ncbi:MAG: glycine zipper family protein [Gammaproteobacteria bacterium]|nr:glycine zipper family protein [Gammaproteobacteria bacterium]
MEFKATNGGGLLAALILAACSSHPEPIVDTKGVDMSLYEADLAECSAYSDQIRTEEGVAKGAAGGTVIGAATGAISGDAGKGAGYGSILGATRSGLDADRDKQHVVKNCMRGRGYKVLN